MGSDRFKKVGVLQSPEGGLFSLPRELAYLYWTELAGEVDGWLKDRARRLADVKREHRRAIVTGIIVCVGLVGGAWAWAEVEGSLYFFYGGAFLAVIAACFFMKKIGSRRQSARAILAEVFPDQLRKVELLHRRVAVIPMGDRVVYVDEDRAGDPLALTYKDVDPQTHAELSDLGGAVASPPAISLPSGDVNLPQCVGGEYEELLLHSMQNVSERISSLESVDLDVVLYDPDAGVARYLASGEGPGEWESEMSTHATQVSALLKVKQQDDAARESGVLNLEDAIEQVVETCEQGMKSLDMARNISLIQHIDQSLRVIDQSSMLSVMRLVCPVCMQKSGALSEGESPDIRISTLQSVYGNKSRTPFNWKSLLKSATLRYHEQNNMYICRQCGTQFKKPPSGHARIHIAKEDLVFPMWDRLWAELDVEHNRIIREKERSLMELRTQEQQQLQHVQAQFDSERRSIREKLDDLVEQMTRCKGSLSGLLDALQKMGLTEGESSSRYESLIESYEKQANSDITNLRQSMREFEEVLTSLDHDAHEKHTVILDEVCAVRNNKRFFSISESENETEEAHA